VRERERLRYEAVRRSRRGDSLRGIGRALGIDWRTVKKLLAEAEARREEGHDRLEESVGKPATPRPSKLDRHRERIAELLTEYPDIRATRVFEELQTDGFEGGYTIVREYLRQVRPKPPTKRFRRVETAPGEQAQADWSPYELADASPLYAWSVVLSYSRYQYMAFTTDMRQPTLFRQLRLAFEDFGGVPTEIVFDSMPGIVDGWEFDEPCLNLRALDFAAHYALTLHIAPRGQGSYKGKVERPFRYAEESLFNGRTFTSLEQARATLRWWLDQRANVRRHQTTRVSPVARLDEERPRLQALPPHPYDDRELAFRIVDGYGRIHFDGNRYSVPLTYAGRRVYVRADEQRVQLYDEQANPLAEHERRLRGEGSDVMDPGHQPRTQRVPHAVLLARFEAWGEPAVAYAKEVVRRQRYHRQQLAQILLLQERYSAQDLVAAMQHARRYGAYSARDVARVLEARATPRQPAEVLADAVRAHIRTSLGDSPVAQRSVGEYARLLDATGPPPGSVQTDDDGSDHAPD
jgi:transposase